MNEYGRISFSLACPVIGLLLPPEFALKEKRIVSAYLPVPPPSAPNTQENGPVGAHWASFQEVVQNVPVMFLRKAQSPRFSPEPVLH